MHELWSSASYEPHLLSLPFAFAPAAMLIVITYALVMRGEPVLRTWILIHFVALMPYSVAMALSPSVVSPGAAEALFKIAAAWIPMAAAAGAVFQLNLLGRRRWRRWSVFAVVLATFWLVVGLATDINLAGVYRLPAGLWYASAGKYAWIALASTVLIASPGFVVLALATRNPAVSPSERRQIKLVLVANIITYSGLTDVMLSYHVGVFPLGWLLSGAGSVLVVRALIFEDLLRVRAVDTSAPQIVLHLAAGLLLGWVTLAMLGDSVTWWGVTLTLATSFAGIRVTIAALTLVNRGMRSAESTLDRLLGQLVTRARRLTAEPAVAQLAIDIVELGLGLRVDVLIASAEDYGWRLTSGARVADDDAPDPLLGAWFSEQQGAIFDDDLELRVPADLRELLARVFERARARTIVPVTSRDELLALVLVPRSARRVRGRSLAFLERAAERLGEGIVHARMAQLAAERATLAREVELAATVQAQLLPGTEPHVHGDVTVVGSWMPATRCAGDFWGVYPLDGTQRRVLIAIGDVTGHGVASATVTAAAAAACEVAVRRHGAALELAGLVAVLDAAVRRVGGGELSMSCFALIIDMDRAVVSYVSCGHPTPYLCRAAGAELELQALVGRGNPLGGASPVSAKIHERPLQAGDLVVCYTDGVIDAQDPGGHPFGDRRLQRMLRRLDRASLEPRAVHEVVLTGISAHRAGRAPNDDETLVVAQWQPPASRASS